MKNLKIILLAFAALVAALLSFSCDRQSDNANQNEPPTVEFVNTPFDSSEFNFAPRVYWQGHDSDGLISGFEYFDDSTQAGREAYRQGGTVWMAYALGIPAANWVRTARSEETVYLGTIEGEIKEHVFFVRSIDNDDARSLPAVRIFFRTNLPPFGPEMKWAADTMDYRNKYHIPDTLFWGDTITTTYPGMEFLWRGNDPDSRELNIIPLEFSYVLVRLRDENHNTVNDTVPYPIYNDSLRIIGYGEGWSPWTSLTSAVFFGQETGDFEFTVRARDDGLTQCDSDSFAQETFYAIKPTFSKQLLIINENSHLSAGDRNNFGGREPDSIMADYLELLPEAYQLAELIRHTPPYDSLIPEPLEYRFGDNVLVFDGTQDCASAGSYPVELMAQFKWIWLITDDNCPNTDYPGTLARIVGLQRYLDVGGALMISGRRLFATTYFMSACPAAPTEEIRNFFADYFSINSVCAKPNQTLATGADFCGAITGDQFLPDLQIDSAEVCSLHWATRRACALPGIEYVSRAISQNSFDASGTLYNYKSNTTELSYDTIDVDCEVFSASASRAELQPAEGHLTILSVHRIYNRTRGVSGQFERMGSVLIGSLTFPVIVCSTPAGAGRWLTTDTLEVDYTFSPVSDENNRPVGIFFQKHSSVQQFDQRTNEFRFTLQVRYRTVLYTFPLSFLDTTPVDLPGIPFAVNPVAYMIANHIIQFNSPRDLGEFNFDIGG